jgi:hypothetical protein
MKIIVTRTDYKKASRHTWAMVNHDVELIDYDRYELLVNPARLRLLRKDTLGTEKVIRTYVNSVLTPTKLISTNQTKTSKTVYEFDFNGGIEVN